MKSSEKAENGERQASPAAPRIAGPCRRGGAAIMLFSAPARQGEFPARPGAASRLKIALETQNTLRKPMDGTGTSPVTVLRQGRTSGR